MVELQSSVWLNEDKRSTNAQQTKQNGDFFNFRQYMNSFGFRYVTRKFKKLIVVTVLTSVLLLLLFAGGPWLQNQSNCNPAILSKFKVCVTCPNSNLWSYGEDQNNVLLMNMQGRLGNQLFQYASLLSIAQQTKKIPIIVGNLGNFFKSFPNNSICKLTSNFLFNAASRLFLSKCIDVDHCRFAQSNIDCVSNSVNVEMVGYLQSYRYFESRRGELLNELSFGEEIRERAESQVKAARIKAERYYKQRELSSSSSLSSVSSSSLPSPSSRRIDHQETWKNSSTGVRLVGVHVRHGDIVAKQVYVDFGYVTAPPTYLARAASYFVSRYERVYFLVCSDDYSWTRGVWPAEFVERTEFCDESNGAEVDMAVLSRCDDSLITVGSFSFWAAYLRETIQLKESGSLAEAKSGLIQTREASVNFSSIAQSQSQLKRTSKKWKARRQDEAKTTGDVSGYGKRVGETVYYAKPYREGTELASLFTMEDYYPSTWRAME